MIHASAQGFNPGFQSLDSRLSETLAPTNLGLGFALGLQIAQSRYYLQTLDPKVGTTCILGALGLGFRTTATFALSLVHFSIVLRV